MITFFISLLFHAFERHTVRIQGDEGSSIRCFPTFTRTVAPLQISAMSNSTVWASVNRYEKGRKAQICLVMRVTYVTTYHLDFTQLF